MSQSLVQIYLHIVFSTKHRQPFLTDKLFRERTHAYLAGICKNLDSPSLRIGGAATASGNSGQSWQIEETCAGVCFFLHHPC